MLSVTAESILKNDPAPVAQYRLLRDVLKLPSDSLEVCNARSTLERKASTQHTWLAALHLAQRN
jgi:hypothetical protein